MTNKTWHSTGALLFAALLAGCAHMGATAPPSASRGPVARGLGLDPALEATSAARCTTSPCVHHVTVAAAADGCTVSVVPDVMIVATHREALVRWQIDTPGYRFAPDGVAFDPEKHGRVLAYAVAPGKQFHDPKPLSATLFQFVDSNTVIGAWYYSVTVTDGRRECRLDPPIINEM